MCKSEHFLQWKRLGNLECNVKAEMPALTQSADFTRASAAHARPAVCVHVVLCGSIPVRIRVACTSEARELASQGPSCCSIAPAAACAPPTPGNHQSVLHRHNFVISGTLHKRILDHAMF